MRRVSRISAFTAASILILGVLVLAIELPRRHGERIHRAELRAIRTLERIHDLEREQRRAGGESGRFAFLPELDPSGEADSATAHRLAGHEVPAGRYEGADLVCGGYRFRVYLPDAGGHGVTYAKREEVHRRSARSHLACYAWPDSFGTSGRRTFLLLADGTILGTENQARRYEGAERVPSPGAGFVAADPGSIVDPPAVKASGDRVRGIDGQFWVRVDRAE